MKIMIINGALRRNGSTEGIVEEVRNYLKTTVATFELEVVNLCEKKIQISDSNFYKSSETPDVFIEDDVKEIVRIMIQSDAIVYAFPVCAFGVNSLMQAFLERAGVGFLQFGRPLEGKLASIIVTGRRYAHELAWGQVALNVMLNKMILVGSGFPAVIKNDGQLLGRKILDSEGKKAVQESIEKIVDYFNLISFERVNK